MDEQIESSAQPESPITVRRIATDEEVTGEERDRALSGVRDWLINNQGLMPKPMQQREATRRLAEELAKDNGTLADIFPDDTPE